MDKRRVQNAYRASVDTACAKPTPRICTRIDVQCANVWHAVYKGGGSGMAGMAIEPYQHKYRCDSAIPKRDA